MLAIWYHLTDTLHTQVTHTTHTQGRDMTNERRNYKRTSNNSSNPNKNICALRVAEVLGVAGKVRYLHTISDLVRASRTRFKVTSRAAGLKGKSVGAVRSKLAAIGERERFAAFIVRVDGHVLLLDRQGGTMVDTAPRKRDRRKVTHVYGVGVK